MLQKGEVSLEETYFAKAANLYSKIPIKSPEREGLMAAAIKWATPAGANRGHKRFHQLVAYKLWAQRRYSESRHHFLYSGDGPGLGSMLAEFQYECGYAGEADLFIATTVIQFICLSSTVDIPPTQAQQRSDRPIVANSAAACLNAYVTHHPSINPKPPFELPLLNFCWFLILALKNEATSTLPVFSVLVDKYRLSLDRETTLKQFLDKLGQMYFGLPPPPKKKPGGLFGGLFDQFFNALNDDDDSSDEEAAAGPSTSRRPIAMGSSRSGGATLSGQSQAKPSSSKMATEDLD